LKRKTLAIPIRIVNWSDSSQVVVLFTREHGIVEAVAKGAHRIPNPFQGPFDLAMAWEVVFAERPPERGLSILTEGCVVDGFRGSRRSPCAWAAAAFLIEYLRTVGTAGEPARELFDAAMEVLDGIAGISWPGAGPDAPACPGEDARIASWLISFECLAFRILGLNAPLSACAACGRPWSRSDRPVFFSPPGGGILCGSCRKGREGILVPGGAVRAFDALAGMRPSSPPPAAVWGGGILPDLARILREMRVFLLEHDFRMIKYVPL
jgi:DNA repair protein RecO (recombination protein O)